MVTSPIIGTCHHEINLASVNSLTNTSFKDKIHSIDSDVHGSLGVKTSNAIERHIL